MKNLHPSSNDFEILYRDYYENFEGFSDKTSAHWKKFGELQKVKKVGSKYELTGGGFGTFSKKNIIRSLINIPIKIYLLSMLKGCNPKILREAHKLADKHKIDFSYDLSRMALSLDLLSQKIDDLASKTFCVIGDGYGFLGCLIKKIYPNTKIIYVNLGRTLLFDFYYSKECFPELKHRLIRSNQDYLLADFNYIEAEYFDQVTFASDIFINIASMQEMNYEVISGYFDAFHNQDIDCWFYCCNRVSKILPDGAVINFSEYGWTDSDQILIDELCPWHQHFPINYPPFSKKFDGPHRHRLIKINK